MHVSSALSSRRSVRAFFDRSVPRALVEKILELAALAPSSRNLQPWRVYALMGPALTALVEFVRVRALLLPGGEAPECQTYLSSLGDRYAARSAASSSLLYGALGIARDDAVARQQHTARNWEFYGAPVGLIFTIQRGMKQAQWRDLGMYMQSVMLLAREYELDTCAQDSWAVWPNALAAFLSLPADEIVACGMALGYANGSAPVNNLEKLRAPFEEYATIVDTV